MPMDAICMTMILLNLNCRAVYATRRRTISLIAISNNVGGVKHDLSTRRRALCEERHFALVDKLRIPTLGSLESSGSGTQSDPAISSITTCDHDSCFELPARGSGIPNH